MLLQNLTETNHPSSVQVSLVPEESGEIRIQKLHGKLSETKIRDICDMVISAIDDIRIVSIDEDELLEGNIKKDKKLPLQCSDDERWCRGARIRSDWSSDNWENRNIQ